MHTRMMQTFLLMTGTLILSSLFYARVEGIHRGGPVMIPIVMCSIFALAITVERLLYYVLSAKRHSHHWLERLRESVSRHRWDEALELCAPLDDPLARTLGVKAEPVSAVIRAGLSVSERTPKAMQQAMEEAAMEELPRVEQHLRWLATIAQVATLLGLLGTVTGMVRCFRIIQEKSTGATPVSPGDLAGGIWEALLTTVAGLVVAIPTLVAFNYLANRAAEIRLQIERSASLIVTWASSHPRAPKSLSPPVKD